jgi:PKD repeat protein
MRIRSTTIVLAIGLLAIASAPFLCQNVSAQVYPTVSLTIFRVQEIDPIDLMFGDWDWYYYVGILDSTWTWFFFEAPNGVDVEINETHDFTVTSSTFTFSLVFCEGDFWTNDDRADVSSNATRGPDDVISCIPSPGDVPEGAYVGHWNLVTETLSGDSTIQELGYYKTSGEYDGSTGDDENDANVWFDINDNYSPPVADAGPSKSGYLGDIISFDASSSSASTGSSIESYAWDFNDDGSYDSSSKFDTWTFPTKGPHTVRLKVTDSLGVHDYDTITVEILNREPVAAFTCYPINATTSDDISFIDSSTDIDGTIESWAWDFGDGEISIDQNPFHRYSEAGEYDVELEITDNDGDTNTFSLTVHVKQAEEGGFGDLRGGWLWILIMAIIVVIALILAFLLLRRRTKGDELPESVDSEEQPPVL